MCVAEGWGSPAPLALTKLGVVRLGKALPGLASFGQGMGHGHGGRSLGMALGSNAERRPSGGG